MIKRELTDKIAELRTKFPVISLTGPRQSGKTTLLRFIFTDLPYVTLEDIDMRTMAISDPRGFLSNYPNGAVLDEVQNVPELFSYIQGIVDTKDIQFVLSGSQNFVMLQSITQSLAGRTAILKLLPFSYEELKNEKIIFEEYEDYLFRGMYPRIYDKNIDASDFYPAYINTYIEKDVRQIKNIENLNSFAVFLQLCAGRVGQILNLSSLASDAGISPNTVKAWLSILEASYIIYSLQPYHKNLNKRIVKSPKLYFHDTGLACSLLGLEDVTQLRTHYLKGALFENFVINEFLKYRLNHGKKAHLYFWQSKTKREVDLIYEVGGQQFLYEIKSGKTINEHFADNLVYWQKLAAADPKYFHVIYGGNNHLKTSTANFISWKKMGSVMRY